MNATTPMTYQMINAMICVARLDVSSRALLWPRRQAGRRANWGNDFVVQLGLHAPATDLVEPWLEGVERRELSRQRPLRCEYSVRDAIRSAPRILHHGVKRRLAVRFRRTQPALAPKAGMTSMGMTHFMIWIHHHGACASGDG